MINWSDIANQIQNLNNTINANQQQRAEVIQPWQQFFMPLQINSNAPDVLMQQARDTLENFYYNYVAGYGNNTNLLYAAGAILLLLLI